MKRVLSIDGGGIRGVIPAVVLAELEELAGCSCAEMFDLIAGTSTGGIIALGLTIAGDNGKPKYSASDLVDIYVKDGRRIFHRDFFHRVRSAEGFLDEKYPADGIEAVLNEKFADARLKDTLVPVLVPSYALGVRLPFFFKTRNAIAREAEGYDFLVRDVARATSAAPTFFEPAKVESERSLEGYYGLIDGGVYLNNPSMCAYVEAVTKLGAKDPLVLSLGTGYNNEPIDYDKAKGWGKAGWALPILEAVFDGVSDTVNYQLSKLLPEDRYFRFEPTLASENTDMDDASESNIEALLQAARDLAKKERAQLARVVELLQEVP